ncbi:caspase family protein [Rhizobium sp. L1K21]|uniref:caspase family protein n=1 Tax=Rhizobium sp. L1K21 TaxID=2954933 RepID=UPI002093BF3A|nr:caspase family protein [Rhizobium sp. L1K21]MCO6187496.1 caspase family protein [Rhizobium sp. L1K21]
MSAEKVALVIGNSDYQQVNKLPNAAQDAKDVAATLEGLGFRVFLGTDLARADILKLAQEVRKTLQPDDIGLFYFSGHAVQFGAENFLIPVDAFGEDESAIRERSVKLQTVLAEMESRADRNIIILDACRNNPFELPATGRSIGGPSRGLAKVDAGVGSFIAFSTQPGNVASDGAGRNSPFTTALLKYLPSTDDDLHEVMRKVRRDVVEETNSEQIPWENSSLIERIYLAPNAKINAEKPVIAEPKPAQQAASLFTYEVAGLDPNGDGFLALRDGTSSSAHRIMKMTEGTRLQVLEQDGVWFKVLTEAGALGWAHSNWIRFRGTNTYEPAPAAESCDSLWYRRNAIYARNGYCFQSTRGRQTFSNEGCLVGVSAGNIRLTPAEKREVETIVAREKALNCR